MYLAWCQLMGNMDISSAGTAMNPGNNNPLLAYQNKVALQRQQEIGGLDLQLNSLSPRNQQSLSPRSPHGCSPLGSPNKSHKCQHCYKAFPSTQQLGQHSLVHSNVRKYACNYCDKTFKQLSHLQQHHRRHTGERPYRCPFVGCEKAFAQLSNLQQHQRNHENKLAAEEQRPFFCRICDRRFTTDNGLTKHIAKLHNGVLPELPDTKCPVCNKDFQSFELQIKHIFELHQEYWHIFSGGRPLDVFIQQRESKHREKRFTCDICKKYYSHETGYLKHMATHPEMGNLRMSFWTCDVCQKIFTKVSFLERHMDMKADEAHRRALASFKMSHAERSRAEVTAAAGSAAQGGPSTSGSAPVSMMKNVSAVSSSRPVFPTANSVVKSGVLAKDSQAWVKTTSPSNANGWKGLDDFPMTNAHHSNNGHTQVSLATTASQFSKEVQRAEQTLSQSAATFLNANMVSGEEKGIFTLAANNNAKEMNPNNDSMKIDTNKSSSNKNAEHCKKAIFSVPQGLCSPAVSIAGQFPPNTITPRIAPDGMFPSVSSGYRPMTPLEQLALAGSSMVHSPSGLVAGFPMRSGHMPLAPGSSGGIMAAHGHLPVPRLPDPDDQDEIANALQSIASQVVGHK